MVSADGGGPAEVMLELTGLTKRFGGVAAVDGVDLVHDKGGVVGLIGPNGAGKTTVFNLLSGIETPTAGSIRIDGTDVTGWRPDRIARLGVARTFQNLQIFGSLSVLDNVVVSRVLHTRDGMSRALLRLPAARRAEREQAEVARTMLARTGLTRLAKKPAASLPYGLQRRVEIARALAAEPRLLLLDEPLAGLSANERGELLALVREMASDGVTVVLVEHDVGSVLEVSERVVVLDHGTLLADGAPTAVQADPKVRGAYLGEEAW